MQHLAAKKILFSFFQNLDESVLSLFLSHATISERFGSDLTKLRMVSFGIVQAEGLGYMTKRIKKSELYTILSLAGYTTIPRGTTTAELENMLKIDLMREGYLETSLPRFLDCADSSQILVIFFKVFGEQIPSQSLTKNIELLAMLIHSAGLMNILREFGIESLLRCYQQRGYESLSAKGIRKTTLVNALVHLKSYQEQLEEEQRESQSRTQSNKKRKIDESGVLATTSDKNAESESEIVSPFLGHFSFENASSTESKSQHSRRRIKEMSPLLLGSASDHKDEKKEAFYIEISSDEE
eukprot:TRINITY_DN11442_c0_g1_i1.p1 TRINITY_DN11442_c0_g1~~TRINITY_DN11442_c0_g1_i1.p1  ORF type:complete len:297 (+),score=86.75 TRINITY_DN11442_c0_g1_i1:46-936(+)